ncbi:MAG: hypothetical protein EpisKO_00670 [Epibacterium sp.]
MLSGAHTNIEVYMCDLATGALEYPGQMDTSRAACGAWNRPQSGPVRIAKYGEIPICIVHGQRPITPTVTCQRGTR